MNVTFLIGNGFDLQLGLNTNYSQFLDWYVIKPSEDKDIALFRHRLESERGQSLWWSDAEVAMGVMFGEYTKQNIEKYYKCIRDFKQQLVAYLRLEQEKCNYSNKEEIAKKFTSFLQTYQTEIMLNQSTLYFQRRGESATYSFVNFNYTNTLSKIIQCCGGQGARIGSYIYNGNSYADSIGKVIPVHGELSSSIIMGLNDDKQIKSNGETLSPKARRTLIKPIVNNALGRTEDATAENTIATSDAIVVYGLSMGETDRKWWNLLREWMVRSESHRIVWFTRSNADTLDPAIPEDLLDYVEEQKENLLSKFKISREHKNYNSIKQRIFIIRNTKKLNFTIVDKKVLVAV